MPQTAAPDLSSLPLFASLQSEALQRLQARLIFRELPANHEILKPGARPGQFAIVERGLVCLEGANGLLHTVGAGGSFGDAMLRYGVPSAFSARTLAPTILWTLTHADWLAVRQTLTIQQAAPKNAASQLATSASRTTLSPEDSLPLPNMSASLSRSRARRSAWLLLIAILVLVLLVTGPQLATAGGGRLALLALDAQRPTEAAMGLRLALTLQPDAASLHDTYGYLLFRQGDLENAQGEFERALSLDPELASALNNLGVTLLAAGQPEDGLRSLEGASTLDPGNAGLQANLGDAYLANGDLDSAMAAYQRSFTLEPAQHKARSQWAGLALQRGQLEAARQVWLEVIDAQPQNAQAQLGLGMIAWREGRPAAAAQHLQSARQADPGDPLTRLYLGLALQAIGRPEKAALEFEQVLVLSQDSGLLDLAREHLMDLYQSLYATGSPHSAGVEGGEQLPVP